MKNKLRILYCLLFTVLLLSCNDDNDKSTDKEITLDHSELYLIPNQQTEVKIKSGNGNYVVRVSNENLITTHVENDIIYITAANVSYNANALLYVTDAGQKTVSIPLYISKEHDLKLDKHDLKLSYSEDGTTQTEEVRVRSGNGHYIAQIISGDIHSVAIDTVGLARYGKFSVTSNGISDEVVTIKVTDAKQKEASVDVFIVNVPTITVDNFDVTLSKNQEQVVLNILTGSGEYKVSVDDPLVARARINNKELIVTALNTGETNVYLTDSNGQKSQAIHVAVSTFANKALNMGDDYFCHTKFSNLSILYPEVSALKQTTWEMNCKIHNYRGLQTFFGLEGKLIVRGKNDDYRDTHPIEIAGLGDKIMLLTKSNFEIGKWMHLALVIDCEQSATLDKYRLFVNGVQQELEIVKEEETHTSVNMTNSSDGNRFVIGRATTQNWRVIKGAVSEARIWSTARTPEQLNANMCEMQDIREEGLLSRWTFDADITTGSIIDVAGHAANADLEISKASESNYNNVTVLQDRFIDTSCIN